MRISDMSTMAETGCFLADYVKWLWGCGATCTRIEKNVDRIALTFGYDIDLTLLPRHATIVLRNKLDKKESSTTTTTLHPCSINFDLNSRLSNLSWRIADNHLSPDSARHQFERIISRHYTVDWTTLLLVSLANASFCRLFGGDAYAMAVVFLSTMVGFALKTCLQHRSIDPRIVFFLCATVSSSLASVAVLLNIGTTPGVALATSVLYLIPGVPYINSASDMIARHYLCAFYRFIDALILTACLSLGLCVGLMVMNLKPI